MVPEAGLLKVGLFVLKFIRFLTAYVNIDDEKWLMSSRNSKANIRKFHANSDGKKYIMDYISHMKQSSVNNYPSEKLDDKILRKYVRQYIDDIFVEFGE
jgi:hypothetical protein